MSANFPIFHGVTLAAGATLDNLNVEILASDPSPVSAGRIWFNSTTKQLKYSSLNSGGAVIVVANVVAADVAAALSSSESYTDAAIASLVDTAPALLNTLNELAAAIADDANFATTVTAQIAAAKSEIQGGVSGAFDTLAEVETALGVINGADSVTGSIAKAVKTEKTRAEGAESTLTGAVTLLNNTDTTSGSVAYAVKAETTRATAAETTLTSAVTLINNTDTTSGSFAYAVKTEKTRAEAAEAQIRTDINAGNVTFQSGATATTHTFSHNLNSDFITFSVMVLRDDGKYRNDIVSVEAYDANTLKVYLTEARHVRVSAVSMTSL